MRAKSRPLRGDGAEMASGAVIVIPMLPAPELSPNARVHWRVRARAAQAAREAAGWATRAALDAGSPVCQWCGYDHGGVVMDLHIAWCCGRKRTDDDNAWASAKAFRDGIADVLWGGEDRHVRTGTVTQTRGEGTTTITLRRA